MAEKKGLYYYVNKRKKAGTSRSKNNPKAPSDADWKNAAKTAKVSEAIVDHASDCDSDHEVQMARADLYNIADKALKLHKILKNISEQEGLQGWQQAKITKAADYMDAVFSSLNYETMSTMSSVQTRPASNGSVGVASVAMSESEVADYKALLEKAKSKAQQRLMGAVHAAQQGEKPASPEVAKMAKTMPKKAAKDYASTKHKGLPNHVSENELDATEAKWYSGPKPPPRKKPKPGAPQKKNRLRNIAGAAALAGATLGAGGAANDYVQNFGNNNTAQATQSQQAADVGGAGLSGAKATAKYTPGSPAAKLASLPSDAALDAQAAQIEKDFAAKNAKNDANAKAQSSAERDAARLQDLQARQPAINQAVVDQGASKNAAAKGSGSPGSDLQAALARQFNDYEKSKDAAVDDLVRQAEPLGKFAGDAANAINTGAGKTIDAMRGGKSGDSGSVKPTTSTTANTIQTVDPTFMPSVDGTFAKSKATWLATNPYPEKIRAFNELITFYNKAAKMGGPAVQRKGVAVVDKWLADPGNAGRGANESKNYRIAENDDDDDTKTKSYTNSRVASSPAQAAAWRQDAFDRSDAAMRKYPDFFTDEHLDRVDEIVDLIERVLTPSKLYITHRFGRPDKGKPQPYTSIAIYHPTWPGTIGQISAARKREFYNPLADLGGIYSKHLANAPGFMVHVIV